MDYIFQVQGSLEETAHLEADFEESGYGFDAFGDNMY